MTSNKKRKPIEISNSIGLDTFDPLYPCNEISAIQFFHSLPQTSVLKAQLCARLNAAFAAQTKHADGVCRFYMAEQPPQLRDLMAFYFVLHSSEQASGLSMDAYDQGVDGTTLGAFHLQPQLSFSSYCLYKEEEHLRCFDVARAVFSSLMEILNHAFSECAYITDLTQNRKQFSNYQRKWLKALNDPIYLAYLICDSADECEVRRQATSPFSIGRQRYSWEL